jgi:carbon monoxide dehydrogenase subunit G
MKSEKLTVAQYAEKREVSPQAITKAIRLKKDLPGVTKVEKVGNTYLLTVKKEI